MLVDSFSTTIEEQRRYSITSTTGPAPPPSMMDRRFSIAPQAPMGRRYSITPSGTAERGILGMERRGSISMERRSSISRERRGSIYDFSTTSRRDSITAYQTDIQMTPMDRRPSVMAYTSPVRRPSIADERRGSIATYTDTSPMGRRPSQSHIVTRRGSIVQFSTDRSPRRGSRQFDRSPVLGRRTITERYAGPMDSILKPRGSVDYTPRGGTSPIGRTPFGK